MRSLDLRVAATRPLADAPARRPPAREGHVPPAAGRPAPDGRRAPYGASLPAADLAALTARAAAWRARPGDVGPAAADVELSVRVLADGGTIAVARQTVDGRTRHIEAIVR
ncbi:MAG TPA: hypothetical protein VEZ47_06160 [Gemmatirosa sp.]|jgi:hypothetical protein|nr:hypothetical protein [Gemmatirosa sp.]